MRQFLNAPWPLAILDAKTQFWTNDCKWTVWVSAENKSSLWFGDHGSRSQGGGYGSAWGGLAVTPLNYFENLFIIFPHCPFINFHTQWPLWEKISESTFVLYNSIDIFVVSATSKLSLRNLDPSCILNYRMHIRFCETSWVWRLLSRKQINVDYIWWCWLLHLETWDVRVCPSWMCRCLLLACVSVLCQVCKWFYTSLLSWLGYSK